MGWIQRLKRLLEEIKYFYLREAYVQQWTSVHGHDDDDDEVFLLFVLDVVNLLYVEWKEVLGSYSFLYKALSHTRNYSFIVPSYTNSQSRDNYV